MQLRVGAAVRLGQSVKILVDLIDLILNALIKAAVNLVACVIDKSFSCKLGNALFRCKVLDYIGDNGLGVVAADRGGGGTVLAADKVKLLGESFLVLLLGDIALIVHTAENFFLTGLIILNTVKRVVVGG